MSSTPPTPSSALSSSSTPLTLPFSTYLVSGAVAGTSVDIVLFPLDTIKTRMQSDVGLAKSGGLKGLWKGVGSAAAGSAPTAALFFITYEAAKQQFNQLSTNQSLSFLNSSSPLTHCLAASAGEIMACLVRVPTGNFDIAYTICIVSTTLHNTNLFCLSYLDCL